MKIRIEFDNQEDRDDMVRIISKSGCSVWKEDTDCEANPSVLYRLHFEIRSDDKVLKKGG